MNYKIKTKCKLSFFISTKYYLLMQHTYIGTISVGKNYINGWIYVTREKIVIKLLLIAVLLPVAVFGFCITK